MSGITIRRCAVCGTTTALPLGGCPSCGSAQLDTVPTAGRGSLYTWTTTHHAFDPECGSDVPYTIGMVTLDEGARIPARIIADSPLADGLRLELVVDADVLTFQPERSATSS